MATGGGVLFFTVPLVAVVIGIVWAIVAKVWKVASVASLLGLVLTIPGVLLSGVRGDSLIWFGAMLVLIIWRHRPNIERMLSGSEQKVPT